MRIILTLLIVLLTAVSPAAAMDDAAFSTLLEQVQDGSFSSDQIATLKSAAGIHTFTCQQVAKLLAAFSFSADQIKALELVKDRIEDPDNRKLIVEVFSFSVDKTKAGKLLDGIKPAAAARPTGGPGVEINHCGAWPDADLRDLLTGLDDASFSADRLKLLEGSLQRPEGFTAPQVLAVLKRFSFSSDMVKAIRMMDARILGMTCADVMAVIKTFSFSADQLAVLEVLVDTITDAQNRHTAIPVFSFSGDREKAQKILDRAKPRTHLFGAVRDNAVVFVLDVSGSMNATIKSADGTSMSRLDFVRRELRTVLEQQFTPAVSFNILWFSDRVTAWKDGLQPATPENVAAALAAVDAIRANGGTNISEALARAFADPTASTIYFLTDGKPTAGSLQRPADIIKAVETWQGQRKRTVHAIAFLMGMHLGDDKAASADLMLRLSRAGNGRFVRLEDPAAK